MTRLKSRGINVVIYEPALPEDTFHNLTVVSDVGEFKRISDIIVANRMSEDLKDVAGKTFTRDVFHEN